jgi:transposase InsO family protein
MVLQKPVFTLEGDILYYLDPRHGHQKRVVVPEHCREQLLQEHHSSLMGGHFAVKKTYGGLMRHWWWDGMYRDVQKFMRNCPQCTIVTGGGRHHRPPLHPIPVSRPFQIVGVDVMELPVTESGNRYVLVFQDFLTKWPFAFPIPDQKAQRIARLLVTEVVPLFGVPEALLSDRGTNLLSHLMMDVCHLLGIQKLNTTAHHSECDGMVERFNRTLKTMLRKHAAKFGSQWDQYISGALWAYRNVPHESTGEKPSYLLLGIDCRTPTEAALLLPHELEATEVSDYREKVVLSLSASRQMAADAIRAAQAKYKAVYDRSSRVAEETGSSSSFPRRSLGRCGSCPGPGMGRTGSLTGGTLT